MKKNLMFILYWVILLTGSTIIGVVNNKLGWPWWGVIAPAMVWGVCCGLMKKHFY